MHTPGLKVVVPSTPYDAKGLLKSAIRDDEPVMFLEHRFLYGATGDVPEEEYLIPIGKGAVRRECTDVTLVSTSYYLRKALAAAESLAADGISAEVVDPRTLVPLDIDLIAESVRKTGRLLILQESSAIAGFGAEIVRQVVDQAFDFLDAPPRIVSSAHVPMPFSPPLEDTCLPQEEDVERAVRKLLDVWG